MKRPRWSIGAALVILACSPGSRTIRIHEGSRLSTPEAYAARRGIELLGSERNDLVYDVREESFELFVPPASRDSWSALVWMDAGDSGAPPRGWLPVLRERSVVWIAANSAGNRRPPADRINLALDAADAIGRDYGVPPSRLYVGGFSGGARVATEAALLYPEVFAGGLFIAGADYFRVVRSSDPRWSAWKPAFHPPPASVLARARECGRYAFVTGTRDFNRFLVRDVHDALTADGFAGSEFIEVPGLGHERPSAEWFDRVLAGLLDGAGRPRASTRRCG